jgi:hypothetical protein
MTPQIAICLVCALYELTTETGLPNLEENLRYAVTTEQRCLSDSDLATVFPILQHPSLADCALRDREGSDDELSYVLACEGDHGTTGTATWRLGPNVLQGTLQVKLGGKNMTLFQRITAKRLGECSDPVE